MISIIIVVKNDRGIDKTIQSIKKNVAIPCPIEIIVVDASEGNINDIRNKYDSQVLWYTYTNKTEKKITISEQRNLGITKSKGDVIVFIDANCIPNRDWLVELYKTYVQEESQIVAGRVLSTKEGVLNTINNELVMKGKYIREAPTINLLIAKSVFKKIGMFDESFGYGEDIDFTWRAVDSGFKIRFQPNAIVHHDYGSFSDMVKRYERYGEARLYLYSKNKHRIKNLFSYDVIVLVSPFYFFLILISVKQPIFLIFVIILLAKNYKKSPFMQFFLNTVFGIGVLKGLAKKLLHIK